MLHGFWSVPLCFCYCLLPHTDEGIASSNRFFASFFWKQMRFIPVSFIWFNFVLSAISGQTIFHFVYFNNMCLVGSTIALPNLLFLSYHNSIDDTVGKIFYITVPKLNFIWKKQLIASKNVKKFEENTNKFTNILSSKI